MLPILYQDAHLLAVDKPAGLLVHRSALDAGETRSAVQLLHQQIQRPVYPVHRLDKGTSGVLLFALDTRTACTLGQAWATHAVHKHYLAMVRGWPADAGTIDHPLRRLDDDARGPRGQPVQAAMTHFRTLEHLALPLRDRNFEHTRCACIELTPETGRRHQLRRHCKHIAHPIVGDATHGKGALNRSVAALLGVQRLWLHAQALRFKHPVDGALLTIEATPDASWRLWRRFIQSGDQQPSPSTAF